MDLRQYQMQIVLSAVVTLGALVALICDLLRRHNEQLRELNIELKVRREEESKRFQLMVPRAMAQPSAALPQASALQTVASPAPQAAASAAHPELSLTQREPKAEQKRDRRPGRREEGKRAMSSDALAAIQRGEQLAASPRPRRMPEPSLAQVSTVERSTVERSTAERSTAERSTAEVSLAEISVKETAPAPQPVADRVVIQPAVVEPVAINPIVIEPVVEVLPAAASSGKTRDWGSLLNSRKNTAPPARREIRTSPQPKEFSLPAGFQDGYVLTRLVESRQPVSGLVVSIGASAITNQDSSMPDNVRDLIQSLLGPNDFAAQSGKDGFLLIYPNERGASAQRKLSQIAEQLWDFQLRSMGTLSILFSWGGVEVRSESIDEAIASATERMHETRRGRKILTMESRQDAEMPLRRAV